jgi:hypothetical protein
MSRPKRKAATNKSYNDFIDESIFEDHRPDPQVSRKKPKTSSVPPNSSTLAAELSSFQFNWQPSPTPADYFSNKLDLKDAYIDLTTQTLYCPAMENPKRTRRQSDVFHIQKGDYIYMISEPPGEPYYVARVMGFKIKGGRANNADEDHSKSTESTHVEASEYQFQVQWFYRPRDISKFSNDSRLLYASMHTDTCPLASFRGLVTVKHKYEIEKDPEYEPGTRSPTPASALETYANEPNCFYFDKLFDRYMVKFYDIIPTRLLLDGSKSEQCRNYLIALHKRFEYVFVETLRSKTFIEGFMRDIASCEKCGQWCSNPESVCCASCGKHFHMYCLDPPLMKKPSRGFSWSCAPCTKKYDIAHQKKRILMLSHDNKLSNAQQLSEELDDSADMSEDETDSDSKANTPSELPRYEKMAIDFLNDDADTSLEQRRLKEEWCMRYLGINSKLEDGVDVEDRSPYPRASTRLGAKHQATHIPEYYDHPIVYYDAEDSGSSSGKKKSKKAPVKSKKKDDAALIPLNVPQEYKDVPPKEYPQWLQPRPKGYIARGEDDGEGVTCKLLWKSSEDDVANNFEKLDSYIALCAPIAESLKILPTSPNFMDAILHQYMEHKGDIEAALSVVSKLTRAKLKEPTFNKEEVKRFENGVRTYGSELFPVQKMVKSQPISMVVRFYYLWKKTEAGKQIWGNFEGRVKRKDQKLKDHAKEEGTSNGTNGHVIDSIANQDDDSSYDMNKIEAEKRSFVCKHCSTTCSLQWFRVTGHNTTADKNTALCFRCARLWRRYAVVWEDPHEVERKSKHFGWKRKIESELLHDSQAILAAAASSAKNGSKETSAKRQTMTPPPSIALSSTSIESLKVTSSAKRKASTKASSPRKAIKVEKRSESVPTKPKAKSKAEPKPKPEPKTKATKSEVKPKSEPKTKPEPKPKTEPKTKPKATKPKAEPTENGTAKAPRKPKKKETKREAPKLGKNTKDEASEVVRYPVFNSDYIVPPIATRSLGGQPVIPDSFINSLGMRKLLDLENYWEYYSIALSPEKQQDDLDPKCCLCSLDTITKKKASTELEILKCRACGVKVHTACASISITSSSFRLEDWICEPCVNKSIPTSSTEYSCCLCFTHFANNGPQSTEYLRCVQDTRMWCHYLCAVLAGDSVSLAVTAAKKKNKHPLDQTSVSQLITVKSVSKLLYENHNTVCHICQRYGGAMLSCELPGETTKVHISCAQVTDGFSLGFTLKETTDNKFAACVELDAGRIVPTVICHALELNMEPKQELNMEPEEELNMESKLDPSLEPNTGIKKYALSQLGKRVNGTNTLKPLFQMHIENITRGTQPSSHLGPLAFSNQLALVNQNVPQAIKTELEEKKCSECFTIASPIWWEGSELDKPDGVYCNVCYHKHHQLEDNEYLVEDEVNLEDLINSPLDPSQYGLVSTDDVLGRAYPATENVSVQ